MGAPTPIPLCSGGLQPPTPGDKVFAPGPERPRETPRKPPGFGGSYPHQTPHFHLGGSNPQPPGIRFLHPGQKAPREAQPWASRGPPGSRGAAAVLGLVPHAAIGRRQPRRMAAAAGRRNCKNAASETLPRASPWGLFPGTGGPFPGTPRGTGTPGGPPGLGAPTSSAPQFWGSHPLICPACVREAGPVHNSRMLCKNFKNICFFHIKPCDFSKCVREA